MLFERGSSIASRSSTHTAVFRTSDCHWHQPDLGAGIGDRTISGPVQLEQLGNTMPPVTCYRRNSQLQCPEAEGRGTRVSHTQPTTNARVELKTGRVEEESLVRSGLCCNANGDRIPLCKPGSVWNDNLPEKGTAHVDMVRIR